MAPNISAARSACYRILCDVESRRMHSDAALNSEPMLRLDARDRNLTTEIVYGTLRWQAPLDHVLAASGSRPWDRVDAGVKTLLRMSLYQLWRMDRVPAYAVVHDAVELAKRRLRRGAEGYVNGVLRALARTRPWEEAAFLGTAPLHVRASLPRWLWERWRARYGEEAAMEYALSLTAPPRAAFRFAAPTGAGNAPPVPASPSGLVPGAFLRDAPAGSPEAEGSSDARIQYQDEASQLIPHLLRPLEGMRVWDACAAPGGKTGILARLCGPSGSVTAGDSRQERVSRLVRSLRDAGWANVRVVVADARAAPPFREAFDAVLADVPCSGLGTLRKNPEIKWQFDAGRFEALGETQRRILDRVSCAVRRGGRLLYSTCSTEPEENERIVEDFLSGHPDFRIERPEHPPGIDTWIGADSMVRTFPGRRPWDGFFAALLRRH